MDNFELRSKLNLLTNLAALLGCTVLLTHLYARSGLSPAWILLLLVLICLAGYQLSLFQRPQRQLAQVIRALANGDSTLGLSPGHPMRHQYENVKQQMQTARFEAEQQAQFLQALLVHVDLAVLVCDESNKIIESNPAAAKLLGKKVNHLEQLGDVGILIANADTNIKCTAQWLRGEQQDTLSIHMSLATIQGRKRKVITLQSIHEILLNKEQQAYKQLTRVLTHEVANTITPLASIAQTCQGLMPETLTFIDKENKQDLALALETFSSRTQYLGEFIERFRRVSSLPMPNLSPTSIEPILERIKILFQAQLLEMNTRLELDIQAQQLVMLDASQIEQVLVNLVKNAIEAIDSASKQTTPARHEGGWIRLTLAQNASQQLYIEVADNGPGVAEHVLELIYVPFFTTKQEGSGIGLSLSRQVMINHGGDLVYINKPKGACFRCVFG